MATHLVQLTDTHATRDGGLLGIGVDTNERLATAVERIRGLSPPADAVLLTGDLTDHGTDDEFDALLDRLAPLEVPLLPVAGNHDERAGLRRAFPDLAERCGPDGFWQWSCEVGDVRVVAIDTTIEGRHDGALCSIRLGWLDDVLAAAPSRTTVLAMHHPPFRTGIWWMDEGGLRDGATELREVVARHPQVRRVVCGHHHRSIVTSWGPTVVSVAPSPAHQVHLDLVPESRARFTTEPGAFHLHVVEDGEVVTHQVAVDEPSDVIDLGDAFGGWERFRDRLRSGGELRK